MLYSGVIDVTDITHYKVYLIWIKTELYAEIWLLFCPGYSQPVHLTGI